MDLDLTLEPFPSVSFGIVNFLALDHQNDFYEYSSLLVLVNA